MGLSIVGLNVSIGKTHILYDVDLEVREGEFFSILGNSGSGKSTLLKTIAGFIQEQTGEILLGERPLHVLSPQKRGTIIVFQDMRLFSNMTVGENVSYPLRLKGVKKDERLRRAEEYLDMVQLGGFSHRFVGELSGGQAQRVAIARALAAEPSVLLLDEPFSSLDENLRDDMRRLVLDIHEKTGLTTVMVTHDQHEALALSDRIAVMDGGRIVQVGTPEEVYERPSTFGIATYFADGDVFEGVVRKGVFETRGIKISAARPEGSCKIVVRESAVMVGTGEAEFIVQSLEYRGQTFVATLERDGAQLHRSFGLADKPNIGDRVLVSIDAQKVLFFQDVSSGSV